MKIPAHLIEAIPVALVEIFQQKKPADRVVDFALKSHPKWGSRDRRFFAEKVYTVVRHYRKLWIHAGLDPAVYLKPDQMNLHSMQTLVKALLEESAKKQEVKSFAENESYADWFDERGRAELGADWEPIASALNLQAPVFLRTNLLKINRDKLKNILDQEDVQCRLRSENEITIELTARKNIFNLKSFQKGFFEVQDFSSQQVGLLLDPKPGELIVDGCAGAGGKTLHLAALMKNKGRILAFDIHSRKLEELQKRSKRAGCTLIDAKLIDSSKKIILELEGTADGVLLDVPCSGSGVLKRNPDTKWKLQVSDFEKLLILQSQILEDGSKMVKPGGRLVYATCSIFPSENIQQVMSFIKKNPNFKLETSMFLRPDIHPGDGFFMALLKKN